MSAREMFEKLGYEYFEGQYGIMYEKDYDYLSERIEFYKDDKTFYKQTNMKLEILH